MLVGFVASLLFARLMAESHLFKSVQECAAPLETVIPSHLTVEEAMTALRKKRVQQKIIYFYAVDESHNLKGVVSTRQLLLADPTRKIEEIMQDSVIKVKAGQTLRDALELFARHPLLALPVVDDQGKLIGAIDVQMVTNETVEPGSSEYFQILGFMLEDRKKRSLMQGYKLRMPWLLCNVFSGLICAMISRYFDLVLAKVLLLAFFIPLVLTLSESTSMQSMAQCLQFLRRPRFDWRVAKVRGFREWMLVNMLAVSSAVLVGGLSLFWGQGILPSVAIGIGILFGVSFSALFGICMPILLHHFRLDPKVAAGPVVLMIADILTTAIYLGVATWWLL
jgi:magnesium transporter